MRERVFRRYSLAFQRQVIEQLESGRLDSIEEARGALWDWREEDDSQLAGSAWEESFTGEGGACGEGR